MRDDGKRFRPKLLDVVITIAVVSAALLSLLFIPRSADMVVVLWHGEEIHRGSLGTYAIIVTPDGNNTIYVRNGVAYMYSADCPDGSCVRMGRATPSKPVVCLPNEVIIVITGDDGVDSVTW